MKQINAGKVGKLGLVWSHEFGTNRGLEATPLVVNGVIYTTADWSVVYAMDARTGQVLRTFDPKVSRSRARMICCDVVNRGVALYEGKVYVGTLDGRLFGHSGPPKPAIHMDARRETVREGKFLFSEQSMPCHGIDAVAGSLPDLRYASAEVHRQFANIVLGGARESRGMPSFKNVLDEKKVARSKRMCWRELRNPVAVTGGN